MSGATHTKSRFDIAECFSSIFKNMIPNSLFAASIKPFILSILAEGPNYGYAIIQRVKSVTGGRIEWTISTLYPVLHSADMDSAGADMDFRRGGRGFRRRGRGVRTHGHNLTGARCARARTNQISTRLMEYRSWANCLSPYSPESSFLNAYVTAFELGSQVVARQSVVIVC